ncbi:hypothetical protein [Shimazuella kribbensis]|uniref:hypothetical protein n=1 Tax=Shimazuella kribbensis TaxID=139808 RepID=UPI0003F9FBCE|nr:hypothetical protein [Shimazuella kribbensis]
MGRKVALAVHAIGASCSMYYASPIKDMGRGNRGWNSGVYWISLLIEFHAAVLWDSRPVLFSIFFISYYL